MSQCVECVVLQCVAVCCSVLQCVAVCLRCSSLSPPLFSLSLTHISFSLACTHTLSLARFLSPPRYLLLARAFSALSCNTLLKIHRNTLQHTATHCNAMHYTYARSLSTILSRALSLPSPYSLPFTLTRARSLCPSPPSHPLTLPSSLPSSFSPSFSLAFAGARSLLFGARSLLFGQMTSDYVA